MNSRSELNHRPGYNRRLFAVDIENVIGSGHIDAASVEKAEERVEEEYSIGENDFVVIGVSYDANLFPASAWKGARPVFQRGKDGADHALMHVLDHENVEGRFDEVVLLSGDGIFADSVARLEKLGVRVVVRSEAEHTSRRLARLCTVVDFRILGARGGRGPIAA